MASLLCEAHCTARNGGWFGSQGCGNLAREVVTSDRASNARYRSVARDCWSSLARRRIDLRSAIYRDVARVDLLSLAGAVSTAVGRHRLVAFPFGDLDATAAGSAARSYGAPPAPSAVHCGRSGAHVDALLVYAPLNSERNEFALRHLVSRAKNATRHSLSGYSSLALPLARG